VLERCCGGTALRHDDDSVGVDTVLHLRQQRQQHLVHQDYPILGMVDDVREVVGVQTQVERVQDCAGRGYGEIRLEMLEVIPCQRADAGSGGDAEVLQCDRKPPRAVDELADAVAMNRAIGSTADDLLIGEERCGAVQE